MRAMGRISEVLGLVAVTAGGAYFVLWGCASPPMRVNFSGMPQTNRQGEGSVQGGIANGSVRHPREMDVSSTDVQVFDLRAALGLSSVVDVDLCVQQTIPGGPTRHQAYSLGPRVQVFRSDKFLVMASAALGMGQGTRKAGEFGESETGTVTFQGASGEISMGGWLTPNVGVFQANRLSFMEAGNPEDSTRLVEHGLGVEFRSTRSGLFGSVQAVYSTGDAGGVDVEGSGVSMAVGVRFGGAKNSSRSVTPVPPIVPDGSTWPPPGTEDWPTGTVTEPTPTPMPATEPGEPPPTPTPEATATPPE